MLKIVEQLKIWYRIVVVGADDLYCCVDDLYCSFRYVRVIYEHNISYNQAKLEKSGLKTDPGLFCWCTDWG